MWQFFAVWTASLVRTLRLKELVLAVDETKIGNQFGVLLSAVKGGLPKALPVRVLAQIAASGHPPPCCAL